MPSKTTYYDNGQKKNLDLTVLNCKSSRQDGSTTWWYESGQIKAECNFKSDKRDGLTNGWYEDGQKRLEENYKRNKENGLCTAWYENG
jgi:antitoxin component YwqK of YwqJK toxin-antitoxin module